MLCNCTVCCSFLLNCDLLSLKLLVFTSLVLSISVCIFLVQALVVVADALSVLLNGVAVLFSDATLVGRIGSDFSQSRGCASAAAGVFVLCSN